MDAKYVATFLLVAVMITRIQCDTGDDCATLTQCMGNSGIMFKSAFNPKDAGIVRNFFDIACSNIEALVNCYTRSNMTGCIILLRVFNHQSNADKMRDLFTKVCAQKEGMIDAIVCLSIDTVVQSVQQCSDLPSSNRVTVTCSVFSKILKCAESTGQCSANAVSFLDSNYQEQFNITCPVFKTAVNGFG